MSTSVNVDEVLRQAIANPDSGLSKYKAAVEKRGINVNEGNTLISMIKNMKWETFEELEYLLLGLFPGDKVSEARSIRLVNGEVTDLPERFAQKEDELLEFIKDNQMGTDAENDSMPFWIKKYVEHLQKNTVLERLKRLFSDDKLNRAMEGFAKDLVEKDIDHAALIMETSKDKVSAKKWKEIRREFEVKGLTSKKQKENILTGLVQLFSMFPNYRDRKEVANMLTSALNDTKIQIKYKDDPNQMNIGLMGGSIYSDTYVKNMIKEVGDASKSARDSATTAVSSADLATDAADTAVRSTALSLKQQILYLQEYTEKLKGIAEEVKKAVDEGLGATGTRQDPIASSSSANTGDVNAQLDKLSRKLDEHSRTLTTVKLLTNKLTDNGEFTTKMNQIEATIKELGEKGKQYIQRLIGALKTETSVASVSDDSIKNLTDALVEYVQRTLEETREQMSEQIKKTNEALTNLNIKEAALTTLEGQLQAALEKLTTPPATGTGFAPGTDFQQKTLQAFAGALGGMLLVLNNQAIAKPTNPTTGQPMDLTKLAKDVQTIIAAAKPNEDDSTHGGAPPPADAAAPAGAMTASAKLEQLDQAKKTVRAAISGIDAIVGKSSTVVEAVLDVIKAENPGAPTPAPSQPSAPNANATNDSNTKRSEGLTDTDRKVLGLSAYFEKEGKEQLEEIRQLVETHTAALKGMHASLDNLVGKDAKNRLLAERVRNIKRRLDGDFDLKPKTDVAQSDLKETQIDESIIKSIKAAVSNSVLPPAEPHDYATAPATNSAPAPKTAEQILYDMLQTGIVASMQGLYALVKGDFDQGRRKVQTLAEAAKHAQDVEKRKANVTYAQPFGMYGALNNSNGRIGEHRGGAFEKGSVDNNLAAIKSNAAGIKAMLESEVLKDIMYIDRQFRLSNNPAAVVATGSTPNLFSDLQTQFNMTSANPKSSPLKANLELHAALKSNNLIPREVLKVTAFDKVIFIFVMLFLRVFALAVARYSIERGWISRIPTALGVFVGAYLAILAVFVLVVNLDTYRMRILFNYVNFHANSSYLFAHAFALVAFAFLVYLVMWNLNITVPGAIAPTLNMEERTRLVYRMEILTMIIILFLGVMVALM